MKKPGLVAWYGLLLGLGLAAPLQAAPEYRIKAALLYNLARMVEWPNESIETAKQPFPICFIGEEPFGEALDGIRDKQVRNRPLEFRTGVDLGKLDQCAILFVSPSEAGRLDEILQAAHTLPLLTVSDTEGFAERGVIVNLVRDEKKVRMEINPKAAKRAKLTLSPTLMELATPVEDKFQAR